MTPQKRKYNPNKIISTVVAECFFILTYMKNLHYFSYFFNLFTLVLCAFMAASVVSISRAELG